MNPKPEVKNGTTNPTSDEKRPKPVKIWKVEN